MPNWMEWCRNFS